MSLTPKQQEELNSMQKELWQYLNNLIIGSPLLQELLGVETTKEDE